jgi:hypothetical protein
VSHLEDFKRFLLPLLVIREYIVVILLPSSFFVGSLPSCLIYKSGSLALFNTLWKFSFNDGLMCRGTKWALFKLEPVLKKKQSLLLEFWFILFKVTTSVQVDLSC